jgi:hypothetical protein
VIDLRAAVALSAEQEFQVAGHVASETFPMFRDAQLVQPMPIMIWLAIIVEAAITNWLDMGILLGIQFANAAIGWCAVTTLHPCVHEAYVPVIGFCVLVRCVGLTHVQQLVAAYFRLGQFSPFPNQGATEHDHAHQMCVFD